MRKFWNNVNECLMEMRRGRGREGLIGDMNGRVETCDVADVVGKCGGVN